MSNEQGTKESICEIVGCTSPAVSTRWSLDENRHLEVCWKHSDEAEKTEDK